MKVEHHSLAKLQSWKSRRRKVWCRAWLVLGLFLKITRTEKSMCSPFLSQLCYVWATEEAAKGLVNASGESPCIFETRFCQDACGSSGINCTWSSFCPLDSNRNNTFECFMLAQKNASNLFLEAENPQNIWPTVFVFLLHS